MYQQQTAILEQLALVNESMVTREKKISHGQFNTRNGDWLKPQIAQFIRSVQATTAYDPFAGAGDLLRVVKKMGITQTVGLDIDPHLGWKINDSLINIPRVPGSIIITNPPYLAKYSAKRKRVLQHVRKYYEQWPQFEDLYQIALSQCLEAADNIVAIVPETFINSSFPKERLSSVTILENNPFEDTDFPVCVVCFGREGKKLFQIKVYKNEKYLGPLNWFEALRMSPRHIVPIRFNDPKGDIAIRAVDMPDIKKRIKFLRVKELGYPTSGIKHSSRLITFASIQTHGIDVDRLIGEANNILEEFREKSHDVILSPFKGNDFKGQRRRRLDYRTARAILEKAFTALYLKKVAQGTLWE